MSRLNRSLPRFCLFIALSLFSSSAAAQEEPSPVGSSAAFQDAAEADEAEASAAPESAPQATPSTSPQQADGPATNSSPRSADAPPPPLGEPALAAPPSAAPPAAAPPTNGSSARFSELHGGGSDADYRAFSDDELSRAHKKQNKGGMIAMAVTGGVIVTGAAPLFLIGGLAGISCAAEGLYCPGIGAFIAVTGGISLVSGSMLVGGIVGAEKRRKRRQAIEAEMRRREGSGVTLIEPRLGVAALPGGGALTFSAHY